MRLIDADVIYSEMKDYYFTHRDEHDASWEGGFGKCMNMIPKAPTSDLQLGKWIWDGDIFDLEKEYICSECRCYALEKDGTQIRSSFCPNCGAKMDKNQ